AWNLALCFSSGAKGNLSSLWRTYAGLLTTLTPAHGSMFTNLNVDAECSQLLLEHHIHEQPVSFYIDYVAVGSRAAPDEVQTHAASAHAHVADIEKIQPIGQFRIDDVQQVARSAGPDAQ